MERILIDTNILIEREENKVIDKDVSHLYRMLFDSEQYKLVIHPMSIKDIDNCGDERKKAITLSKLNSYNIIDDPPKPDDRFHASVGCNRNKTNDFVDNNLLFAVYKNCVSYLITNDKKLQNKAKRLKLDDRVIGLSQAVILFDQRDDNALYMPISICETSLYNIDLQDPFFNSLRESYSGFDDWFTRKTKEGCKAFISKDTNGGLGSFLLLKNEDAEEAYQDFRRPLSKEKTLKISTFKVADGGKHIGEALIRIIIDRAKADGINQIYSTLFSEQKQLQGLLEEYGFKLYTTKPTKLGNGENAEENVFVKRMDDGGFPNINWDNRAFIVPIKPEYHRRLFIDAEHNYQLSIDDLELGNVPANSIKKAYLCNSPSKKIQKGDILLFYLSKSKKAITTVGIVDEVFSEFESVEEMLSIAGKRTVYSVEDIKPVFEKQDAKIILFKHCMTLENPVGYAYLREREILAGPPESITELKKTSVIELKKRVKDFNK